MAKSPAVIECREARALQNVQPRQHVLGDRPDDEATCDSHVEECLKERRRHECRVRRALDAVLGEVEPDDVAAPGWNDGVHAGTGDIGAEHLPRADRPVRVGGRDDVPPGARNGEQLAEVAGDSEREPLEVHRGEVVEEHADRVEDGMDHWLSVAEFGLEVAAAASAATEVAASEAHAPAEVAAASAAGVPAPEAARCAGATPAPVAEAAVGAAQSLADEEAGEEARASEGHEVAAGPWPEVRRRAPVGNHPAPGHNFARGGLGATFDRLRVGLAGRNLPCGPSGRG